MNNKITLNEFFNSKEKLAIHCKTEERANKLLQDFDNLRKTWEDGDSYLEKNYWDVSKEETVYCNNGTHDRLDLAKYLGYTIYEFEDIVFEDNNTLIIENPYKLDCDYSTILTVNKDCSIKLEQPNIFVKGVKIVDEDNRLTVKKDKGYDVKYDGIHTKGELIQMIIDKFGMLEEALIEKFKKEEN